MHPQHCPLAKLIFFYSYFLLPLHKSSGQNLQELGFYFLSNLPHFASFFNKKAIDYINKYHSPILIYLTRNLLSYYCSGLSSNASSIFSTNCEKAPV